MHRLRGARFIIPVAIMLIGLYPIICNNYWVSQWQAVPEYNAGFALKFACEAIFERVIPGGAIFSFGTVMLFYFRRQDA